MLDSVVDFKKFEGEHGIVFRRRYKAGKQWMHEVHLPDVSSTQLLNIMRKIRNSAPGIIKESVSRNANRRTIAFSLKCPTQNLDRTLELIARLVHCNDGAMDSDEPKKQTPIKRRSQPQRNLARRQAIHAQL